MKSASMTNTSQDSAQQDQSSLASPNMQAYEQHQTSAGGNSNGAPQAQGQTQMITTKTGKILDPQQMHVCRLCDKLLSSSSSLDRHMLTHSGERPFVCKRCHMTFTTNGNMHRHMRTHLHKDSLARQQQEQMQLKQSLLAGGSSAGSMASAGVGLNSTTSQQQVAGPGSFGVTGQRDIFSPIVVGSSPVAPAASHFQPHSHANHQQSPGNPLMSAPHMSGSHMAANQHQQQQAAPLVGPLASLLGATTANQSGNHHMQALLNQHLVAAMVQQQQQQQQQLQLNLRNGSNKLELNNLGIQSGRQDQQVTGDISTQLFQNQQAALAAAASQLMQQQQQQQQQCAPAGDLDTKSLMMSAALAAASQDPRVSLESVKAVMLAAAAAAAAATSGAASKTSNSTNNNNLLMELPLDQLLQQRVAEPSRSEQRVVRGKRRKQIKPLRSHQQQQEEAVAGDCRSESGDEHQQPQQQHDHSGASSLIEDLLAGCEARAEHEDRGRASIAKSARVAVKPESELSASPPRQQQREDFNNNSQPAARAHFTDCAISSLDHIIDDHYSRSPSSTTTPTVDRQNVKPCHLFGDSDEQTGGPSGVTKSERLEIDQESGTDIDDQEDQDRGQDSGDNHQRDLPSGSPRFGTGDKNNNDDQNKDKSYNMDQGDSTMRLSVKQREDEEHPQIISNNFNYTNNTTSDSFEDQDYSNTNTSSNSGDRRQSSSFVSSSREIADDGDDEEDEEDNDDDDEEGLMMFGAQTRGEPDEDRQQQQRHQHDDDEERGDSRSGITQLGPGDEDDEIIEDISQSYVKTANPNAMRKGGKRNRHCYKCKLCTYSSVDRCTLVRHLRIHSGERPYICGICRYAFTTKANCERHVRKRHKKQYNSLGGSGGVKGSNGGGRSLIITDHSNHQTIPVKVNPVAAQTISQTLRRIQEKEQQQQQLDVHDGLQPSLDLVGGHHRASMLNDDNIERIGQQGGLGSNNSNNNNNDIKSIRSSAKMSSLSTLNGKRKHKATLETDHDQDIQSYQRRRLAAGKHQLTTRGDQLPAPLGMLGGLMGLSNEQLPTGYDRASIQAAAANFLGAAATSVDKDTTATTSELFANLLSQIQQINNNNNHNGDEHIATTSTSSKQRTVTSDSPVSNATFLANMLAAGKAMATSSETPVVLPATFNSLISTKDLSHQFAQLRDLNQQSNFFNRRNPFDPFNSLELAAQALDLSCSQQPGHK